MMDSILLVEDKRAMRNMLTTALREDGWNVIAASSGAEAISKLGCGSTALVLSDICLPGEISGMDILRRSRELNHWVPVVLMTAFGTVDLAVEAMKEGARDFITKPFDLDELLAMVRRYSNSAGTELVGSSPSLMATLRRVSKGAETNLNILILGESGTGKELLARLIHRESSRSEGPFVPVNCAAIPADLLESELFGAEKGAYTGADRTRPGRFEHAQGGSIFLDEVGDLDRTLQGKLLRVLQEREYTRVGGTEIFHTNARVISASNRDLKRETEEGRFRDDLYFRIGEFPVSISPLRDRSEDVPLLARHFLDRSGYSRIEITDDAMEKLKAFRWPGNVRQLRSIVLRAAALADGPVLGPDNLEIEGPDRETGLLEQSARAARDREVQLIRRALRETGGNRKKAAELLKVSYRTLLSRLKELDL
ncbi:MAG: sigma-54-dependent Fis family transcriptional regulator [Candidatus Fermentibacteraceae bacterium]|nr:sigma-54-dependent Fis family transcriptional regulator [Candidatus Fermentibacteraceae bacterium]